ncbi:MAG: RND transporter, partial [Polyangia bacterium]
MAIALGLAGCALGPDYVRPDPPKTSSYTASPIPKATSVADGQAQRFEDGKRIDADWWRLFKNPKVDAFIAQSMAENATLQAAQATLRQSQDILR